MSASIYDFADYRAFLRAWLADRKQRSVRLLAGRLEVSPASVSMICKGSRNLRLEHARHWAESGLRLDREEADHWLAMVRLEHGATDRERDVAARQIRAAQAWQNAVRRTRAFAAYSAWYGGVIREMAKLPGFVATGEWIGPRLRPPVDPAEVQATLDLLFEHGQLVRTDDGSVAKGPGNNATEVQVSDAAISRAMTLNHKVWLSRGIEDLERAAPEGRYAHRVVALDQARLAELLEALVPRQIEIAEAAESQSANSVVSIGVVVVPRSRAAED